MVAIPNEIRNGINSIYDQQRKAEMAKFQSARSNALRGLNQQKVELGQANYANRNQADVVSAQNMARQREMMAAQGLGNSGENISAMVGLQSARQNALGDLNTSYQNSLSGINNQIASVNDPSQQNSILADIEARRSQALLDAYQQALADAQRQASLSVSRASSHRTVSPRKTVRTPAEQRMENIVKAYNKVQSYNKQGTTNTYTNSFRHIFGPQMLHS